MTERRNRITIIVTRLVGVTAMMLLPLTAAAATVIVNATADNSTGGDRQCTLREAIANVNAAADTTSGDCIAGSGVGDTIAFNLSLPAKIKLALGELAVAQKCDQRGTGSTQAADQRGTREPRASYYGGHNGHLRSATDQRGLPRQAGAHVDIRATVTVSRLLTHRRSWELTRLFCK